MVKAWRELVKIPTYEVGAAEKAPMFLEKRVYQGSSGAVYPYPVIESTADRAVVKKWQAVYLENEFIQVMVLPELGGRIQKAWDKVRQRHFVYYNHVIKPALVGLCGPWISGGIEFNWPQHHRPTTYSPVDSLIEENEDGSVTLWLNEMERMTHQKGTAGITLRPGCAYIEIRGRAANRTPLPQTFLWWANPAVEVNDDYQSVFPPDVNAVFDHGKRAVSSFPIATGTYYKVDYSAGVDISNYKNIPVPTSYMAVNSKYDFEGGYENDTRSGMLHVANHHYSPGKKQWTWGNGDFGRAWDRNLTDPAEPETAKSKARPNEEVSKIYRPYIELMAGVYTENQPDFAWLMPYEEKQFTQYFMPYREVGMVKQANRDFIFGIEPAPADAFAATGRKRTGRTVGPDNSVRQRLEALAETNKAIRHRLQVVAEARKSDEVEGTMADIFGNRWSVPDRHERPGVVIIKLQATSAQKVRLRLESKNGEVHFDQTVDLSPKEVFKQHVAVGDARMDELRFAVLPAKAGRGKTLMTWEAEPDEIRPIPNAAEAALAPKDTKTVDQLYLTGLHLEQYRHATWSALDYYEEALRRDPDDVRCNTQAGLWYLRRARFDKAEAYLRRAVAVWQKRNPNPYDGEALYYLGVTLKYLGRTAEAYDWLWKATWNKGWADAAYYQAACISLAEGRFDDALDELERALISNSHNHQARGLKAVALRKLGRTKEALDWIKESYAIDPFNYVCMVEEYYLTALEEPLRTIRELMHGNAYNYHETALDYAEAGLNEEACFVINQAIDNAEGNSPLNWYYLAYLSPHDLSEKYLNKAKAADPDYCFPNRLEDARILSWAIAANAAGDARAPYYLGCLYYDKRQYDLAVRYWELSANIDPKYPLVWRNLALASFNKQGHVTKAIEYMERAFSLDRSDARMLMELDQLYKRLHKPHDERLERLKQHQALVDSRDDLLLEEITLFNQLGRHAEAKAKLDGHHFHPWEGGEGKVTAQYQICRVEMAKQMLKSSIHSSKARRLLEECLECPPNLGEGKLAGAQDNDILYFLRRYEEGTAGPTEPAAAMYYNDAKPDKIFYAGLCYRAIGQEDKAKALFNRLISYGKQHIFDHITMDYFAVSLPDLLIWDDSLDDRNRVHCLYLLALGYCGMGDMEHALTYLDQAETLDNNHQGLQQLRTFIDLIYSNKK